MTLVDETETTAGSLVAMYCVAQALRFLADKDVENAYQWMLRAKIEFDKSKSNDKTMERPKDS